MELDIVQKCGTECICEGPGQCPCYGVFMNKNLHAKCKRSQNWRENFSNFFESLASEEVRAVTKAREDAAMDSILQELQARREEEKGLNEAMAEIEDKTKAMGEVEGLGDVIENVLTKFGITQELMQKALGTKECGCSKRKQFLNHLFPFASKNDQQKEEDE
jgi:hypothetical protein